MAGRNIGEGAGQDAVAEAQLRASFERRFEGLAVLDGCLQKAGATYTAEEVLEEFAAAAAGGATADEVIPLLFHDHPVVADAAQARRLFSNLFGAWDAAGDAPAVEQGPIEDGAPLPKSFVEASWRATDLLSPAQLRSQWDRFSQSQGDALTFLTGRCRSLSDEAFDTAATALEASGSSTQRASRCERVTALMISCTRADCAKLPWLVSPPARIS